MAEAEGGGRVVCEIKSVYNGPLPVPRDDPLSSVSLMNDRIALNQALVPGTRRAQNEGNVIAVKQRTLLIRQSYISITHAPSARVHA